MECKDVKELWKIIVSKLKELFRLPSNFCCYQSLILRSAAAPHIVNLIVLITKQYIVNCKLSNNDKVQEPSVLCRLNVIAGYAQAERIIAKDHNRLMSLKKNGKSC